MKTSPPKELETRRQGKKKRARKEDPHNLGLKVVEVVPCQQKVSALPVRPHATPLDQELAHNFALQEACKRGLALLLSATTTKVGKGRSLEDSQQRERKHARECKPWSAR